MKTIRYLATGLLILAGSSHILNAQNGQAVYRPSNGTCYSNGNQGSSTVLAIALGQTGDIPVTGDFDGDGVIDCGTYRPSNATWTIYYSSISSIQTMVFGATNATPVPSDYDGDGVTDLATFSNGSWTVQRSSDGGTFNLSWGIAGDIPVAGDFDGDGSSDFAIWRPSTGVWWVSYASGVPYTQRQWGLNGDTPFSGDFDGDGKADYAIYRPSNNFWYIIYSSTGTTTSAFGQTANPFYWQGQHGDIPAAAAYKGDGKTQVASFRPSTGTFYISPGGGIATYSVQFGTNGDIPLQPAPLAAACPTISSSAGCDPE